MWVCDCIAGLNPEGCTKDQNDPYKVGIFNDEGPPVPIPNTEVKLICAEDTWLEAAWENRSMPTPEERIVLRLTKQNSW